MSHRTRSISVLFLLFLFLATFDTSAQIQDIKKKSEKNKSKHSSSSSSSSSYDDDGDSDLARTCGCIGSIGDLMQIFSNLSNAGNKEKSAKVKVANDTIASLPKKTIVVKDTIVKKEAISFDIFAGLDYSGHFGEDNDEYFYTYLASLRAKFNFFLIDFRFNKFDKTAGYGYGDFPGSFKSWELLALFDLTAKKDYSIIVGSGLQNVHSGHQDKKFNFHEFYVGTKIPIRYKKDYVEIDTRFSRDYENERFPYFEVSSKYNFGISNGKNLSTFFTLGMTYQNYFNSYDTSLGMRVGLIFSIH